MSLISPVTSPSMSMLYYCSVSQGGIADYAHRQAQALCSSGKPIHYSVLKTLPYAMEIQQTINYCPL